MKRAGFCVLPGPTALTTLASVKVLVVDDSRLARRMLRTILEESGHEIEEVADGATALERYALNHHDLVLLDLLMPIMSGVEVLKKLREQNPKVSVIVVSADIQRVTREEVMEAGAIAMLSKPFDKEALRQVLASIPAGNIP